MPRTAYITHADFRLHDMGRPHPDTPERLAAIQNHLHAAGLMAQLATYDAIEATPEQILRVHTRAYYDELLAHAPASGLYHLDPDTAMNPHTPRCMHLAAGAGVLAVDKILAGEIDSAFCAVRPGGHHAGRESAMGFCFLNNVAIAGAHALDAHGLERIAIVDFDVHHGNGTEEIFQNDARVLMTGFFQHPLFPYTGIGKHAPNMQNIPVAAGLRKDALRALVSERILPALRQHKPQMLLLSAGFDAHYEDDMGSCGLVESDYAWLTEQLLAVCRDCGHARIVSLLEGGYALSALARSAAAHIKTLAGL